MQFDAETLWKLERVAHQAQTLQTAFAVQGIQQGEDGWGKAYKVVARELRILTEELFSVIELMKFHDPGSNIKEAENTYAELTHNVELLALNTMAICLQQSHCREVIIFARELREIALGMKELLNEEIRKLTILSPSTVLKQYHTVTEASYTFMTYQIGGIKFVENVQFLEEILSYSRAQSENMIDGDILNSRGRKIRFLSSYQILGLKTPASVARQLIMIVLVPHSPSKFISLVVDKVDLKGFFQSQLGRASPFKGLPLKSDYVRECWLTENEDHLLFLDWEKLM